MILKLFFFSFFKLKDLIFVRITKALSKIRIIVGHYISYMYKSIGITHCHCHIGLTVRKSSTKSHWTMASSHQLWSFSFFLMASILAIMSKPTVAVKFRPSPWNLAHATFYGDETASETMGTQFTFIYIIFSHHFILSQKKKTQFKTKISLIIDQITRFDGQNSLLLLTQIWKEEKFKVYFFNPNFTALLRWKIKITLICDEALI